MALLTPQRPYSADAERVANETVTRRIEHFIDYINEFYLRAPFYRVSDVGLQKAGIDLVMNDPNARPGELRSKLVDEKFAVKYMNKDLNSYSFELSSDNNKNREGWFLSDSSKTTHYELVWPKSSNDGHTIDSATIALVSKDAVNKWLTERGVDPHKVLEQMRSHFHGDNSVQHYRNCTYFIQNDWSGRPSKYTMNINGVRVVQSLNGRENPINIIIPREELCRLADKTIDFTGSLHSEYAQQMFQGALHKTYSIDDYITPQSWEKFEQTGNLPGGITFIRNGAVKNRVSSCIRDGQRTLDLRDGDRLCVKTDYGRSVCLGVYAEKKQMWGITGGQSQIIGPEKSFSIADRIKESLQQSKLPFGFVVTNSTFSKQLSLTDLDTPRHGDSVLTFGENTQNKVVHLWYNAYTQRFVLNDNQFIRPEELPTFKGVKVVSERENDLKRAMMDRIVNCIPEIRKAETLSRPELFDKLTTLLTNTQRIWDTPMKRASAEGLALKELMTGKTLSDAQWTEKKELTSCFPNPQNMQAVQKIVGNLATQLSALSLEERRDPDLLSALLYDKQNVDIARISHVRGNPRTATALDLDKIARDLDYPMQRNKPFVAWNNDTIRDMIEHLNSTCDKEKVIVLTGALPAWAMASIAQQVEGSVYIRSDAYTTVPCDSMTKTSDVTQSQGISFEVEKSPDNKTTTITWSIPQGHKLTTEDVRYAKVPDIGPCENLVLQTNGKTPAFLLAAMTKTYSDSAENIIFARHPDQFEDKRSHGGTCIASRDNSRVGSFVPAYMLDNRERAVQSQTPAHVATHTSTFKPQYDMRDPDIQRKEARENRQSLTPNTQERSHSSRELAFV